MQVQNGLGLRGSRGSRRRLSPPECRGPVLSRPLQEGEPKCPGGGGAPDKIRQDIRRLRPVNTCDGRFRDRQVVGVHRVPDAAAGNLHPCNDLFFQFTALLDLSQAKVGQRHPERAFAPDHLHAWPPVVHRVLGVVTGIRLIAGLAACSAAEGPFSVGQSGEPWLVH